MLEATGRSAPQVAAAAGKPDAIRNMKRAVEAGKNQTVTVDTVAAIANELNVSLAWLLTGEGVQTYGSMATEENKPDLDDAIALAEGAMLSAGLDPALLPKLRELLHECLEVPVVSSTPQSALESRRNLTRAAVSKFLRQHDAQAETKQN